MMKKNTLFMVIVCGSLLFSLPMTTYAAPATADKSKAENRSKARQESENGQKQNSAEFSPSSGKMQTITNASELEGLSEDERVPIIAQLCQEDYAKTGILASVTTAQCILESGYMTTSLATDANNCFGMKVTLSGNDWPGSSWDKSSTISKQTWEEYGGKSVTITADFRKYKSVADSIADHSAYLLGAKNGDQLRYPGLTQQTDYKKAIQIIKDGGYATDSNYVAKICKIIEKYDLTKYDQLQISPPASNDELLRDVHFYRVRKSWDDKDSQLGAYLSLEQAKKDCKKGYAVFDWQGKKVFEK